MIYTVTLNPAIDYVISTDNLVTGQVNRGRDESYVVGGKGINVSVVLNNLGIKSTALGFIAGFTGQAIKNSLESQSINCDFIDIKNGFSRINIKLKSDEITEINGQGPVISSEDVENLYSKLDNLSGGDTLVLAGSVPKSIDDDIYENIIKRLEDKNIKFVVDTTNRLLLNVLPYRPFLIKPNNFELGEIFGVTIKADDEIIKYAKLLQDKGAVNVLVSMGADGCILVDANKKIHKMKALKGKLVNSVGCGDSMVAGFIAGTEKNCDYDYALKLATACGGATAFSPLLATKTEIDNLLLKL